SREVSRLAGSLSPAASLQRVPTFAAVGPARQRERRSARRAAGGRAQLSPGARHLGQAGSERAVRVERVAHGRRAVRAAAGRRSGRASAAMGTARHRPAGDSLIPARDGTMRRRIGILGGLVIWWSLMTFAASGFSQTFTASRLPTRLSNSAFWSLMTTLSE